MHPKKNNGVSQTWIILLFATTIRLQAEIVHKPSSRSHFCLSLFAHCVHSQQRPDAKGCWLFFFGNGMCFWPLYAHATVPPPISVNLSIQIRSHPPPPCNTTRCHAKPPPPSQLAPIHPRADLDCLRPADCPSLCVCLSIWIWYCLFPRIFLMRQACIGEQRCTGYRLMSALPHFAFLC